LAHRQSCSCARAALPANHRQPTDAANLLVEIALPFPTARDRATGVKTIKRHMDRNRSQPRGRRDERKAISASKNTAGHDHPIVQEQSQSPGGGDMEL